MIGCDLPPFLSDFLRYSILGLGRGIGISNNNVEERPTQQQLGNKTGLDRAYDILVYFEEQSSDWLGWNKEGW